MKGRSDADLVVERREARKNAQPVRGPDVQVILDRIGDRGLRRERRIDEQPDQVIARLELDMGDEQGRFPHGGHEFRAFTAPRDTRGGHAHGVAISRQKTDPQRGGFSCVTKRDHGRGREVVVGGSIVGLMTRRKRDSGRSPAECLHQWSGASA